MLDSGSSAFLTPGFGIQIRMRKNFGSRIAIPDKHLGSYFRELSNNFLDLKLLKFFIQSCRSGFDIRDGKIQIRDSEWKNPGSGINIPDPQDCS
jgi:hypothetical protein